ncbi:phosphoribosyltransferase family protein [Pseudofrankia sp. BMG5.37]|uniref:phosphoribosyltransferase family protein n=1 Tax=Pseudofrankia sp. BMG5.36 TaxID=1834512 RepID=UPI001F52162A|nr:MULTISPECIES: phosphoribosyltransferase family protein [unclassified Pseudofrankia]MDT3445870.1 phosphoribosyltransferase family protein [Pseudofrankia sp. BMG5.37]
MALGLAAEVTEDVTGAGLGGIVGLALRRNPRRAHLLVSRVLGKHLPVRPEVALGAAAALAARARDVSAVGRAGGAPFVLGYCETATALGHAVADGFADADYLHTTRRAVAGMRSELELAETHSHAVHHWLLPADPRLLTDPRPLLLVDDELSTGNTALGTIRALHALAPRPAYTVATLLDARPAASRARFDEVAAELGVPVDVVSLVSATVAVPPDVADRARALRERHGAAAGGAARANDGVGGAPDGSAMTGLGPPRSVTWLRPPWPAELPDGGRHGWAPRHRGLLDETVGNVAAAIADRLVEPGGRTLVLGTEELMYTPMRLAAALGRATGGDVRYQSTTRSPVHPLDVPGYAIRCALEFPAPDDPGRVSQVYNVAPGRYDDIVVVVDDGTDATAPAAGDGPPPEAAGRLAHGRPRRASKAAWPEAAGRLAHGQPRRASTAAWPAGLVEVLRHCAPVTVVTLPSFVPAGAR